jgi:D-psicose/D-tagatose/L-ribulose 3-epimerase
MTANWAPKIGVISMTYARPITAAQFPLFARMRDAGMDFCELLVPEEDELDPAAAGRAARDAGLSIVLAARVNVDRDLASDCAVARDAGVAYLHRCVDVAAACGADLVGGPLYGTPLVFAGRPPRPFDCAQRAERVARVVAGLQQAGAYAAQK